MSIERVISDGEVLAIIVRRDYSEPGVHFFTPAQFSQQLGYMRHPAGKRIQPHVHVLVEREVALTQEVLFLRRGRVRVDFYSASQEYLESRILQAGDAILLASAGHGFEVLDDVEMIEVKQGPYTEREDKVRFEGLAATDSRRKAR
jgi:mannose-6-phosphate isomerase-like protein (cupin superfamily)